jgi:hypothetical protein
LVVALLEVAQTSLPALSIHSSRSLEVEPALVCTLEKPTSVPPALEVLNQPARENVSGLANDLTVSAQPVDPSNVAPVEANLVMAEPRLTPATGSAGFEAADEASANCTTPQPFDATSPEVAESEPVLERVVEALDVVLVDRVDVGEGAPEHVAWSLVMVERLDAHTTEPVVVPDKIRLPLVKILALLDIAAAKTAAAAMEGTSSAQRPTPKVAKKGSRCPNRDRGEL